MDYIAEANKYMFDDNYITEAAKPTHEVKLDTVFDSPSDKKYYLEQAKKHKILVSFLASRYDNTLLQGSIHDLQEFISSYHDDGSGKPEELKHIKPIK